MGFGSNKGFTPGDELTIKEVDGSPTVPNVKTIVVSNGTLADNGSGQVTLTTGGGGGAGAVVGPGSSTDNAVTRFDTTTGKLLQNSTLLVSDTAQIGVAGDLDLIVPASGTVTFNIGDVAGSDFNITNAAAASLLHVAGDDKQVGIGTNAPNQLLTVAGVVSAFDPSLTLDGELWASTGPAQTGAGAGIPAGSTAVRFRSNGHSHISGSEADRVGIGELSPSSKLHVLCSDKTLTLEKSAGSFFNSFGFDASIPYMTYYSAGGGGMKFGYGESTGGPPTVNTLFLDNDGTVGIGTIDPGTLLQLEGASAYLTLKNSTNEHGDGEAETRIIFEDHSDAALAQIQASHDGDADNTRGDLIFSTNNGTSLAEAIRINRRQFVGIGTAEPGGSSTAGILNVEGTTASSATEGGNIRLSANDGAAIGDTHRLGVIEFAARDNVGGAIAVGAKIEAIAAEAWDATNNAANLDFYTSDGDEVQTKRMSISATGEITSTYATVVAPGAGFDTNTPVYKTQIDHIDGIIRTRIWIDLHPAADSIYSPATFQAVIGDDNSAVANAYFTQITAAKNGAIFYAKMSCLEGPGAGEGKVGVAASTTQDPAAHVLNFGTGDISIAAFFGAAADTGKFSESGQQALTANLADYYLYLYNSNSSAAGGAYTAYTAGQFLIELHGTTLN